MAPAVPAAPCRARENLYGECSLQGCRSNFVPDRSLGLACMVADGVKQTIAVGHHFDYRSRLPGFPDPSMFIGHRLPAVPSILRLPAHPLASRGLPLPRWCSPRRCCTWASSRLALPPACPLRAATSLFPCAPGAFPACNVVAQLMHCGVPVSGCLAPRRARLRMAEVCGRFPAGPVLHFSRLGAAATITLTGTHI